MTEMLNAQKRREFANYSGSTDMGKLGIERYYEEQLHGTTGFEEVEINNRGKVIRKLREQPATAGKSIHLTIDFTPSTLHYVAPFRSKRRCRCA